MSSWRFVCKDTISADIHDFNRAVNVWFEKPHVINRRLNCSTLLWTETLPAEIFNIESFMKQVLAETKNAQKEKELYIKVLSEYVQTIKVGSRNDLDDVKIQLRQLIPKQIDKYEPVFVIVYSTKCTGHAGMFPLTNGASENYVTPPFPFKLNFHFEDDKNWLCLWVFNETNEILNKHPSVNWLKNVIFAKVKKWSETEQSETSIPSLQLIPPDKYSFLYAELKVKYGPDLVKNWPERTDPSKFVYEDIAIAAYLLILWEIEREEKKLQEKQSFVDLGCGNGLLVYLLTKEGHRGLGLDVRKRKIWEMFDSETKLKEESIDPSMDTVYPEYDWLIGNHSDELTPWIPVMAARSSHKTNFFLLPCCFFDFHCKFQRKLSSKCQYQSYLDFVREIIEVSGFKLNVDKLRIPSTKRICFIGTERNYSETEKDLVTQRIDEFVRSRTMQIGDKIEVNGDSSVNFIPRCAVEPVVNCTQLDRGFLDEVVHLIASILLNSSETVIETNKNGSSKLWKTGGKYSVAELAEKLGKEKLLQMKSQCGGLQTMLKNHGHIFQVLSGVVSLRNYTHSFTNTKKPKPVGPFTSSMKRKTCWFHANHPDGCILSSDMCLFIH